MLTIFRRHVKRCTYTSRTERKCKCPIHVEGSLAFKRIRKALDLSSWEAATNLIQGWIVAGEINYQKADIRIEDAVQRFLEDAHARNLQPGTIKNLRNILEKRLLSHCEQRGLRFPKELTVEELRRFRNGWEVGPNTSTKNLESLRGFFRFCLDSKWISENPAKLLKAPKFKQRQTLPFDKEEFQRIIAACNLYPDGRGNVGQPNAEKVRTFVQVLRFSGLRIGDAAMLEKKRLHGDRLRLYTQKTGTPVSVPLPADVVEALQGIANSNPSFFFWSGHSKVSTVTGNWRKYLSKVFKLAGIVKGHPHRFRDTFAVELLQAGVPLDQVSILLGHSSIKVTEKHYSPWIKSRQDQLEKAIRKTW